MRCGKSIGTGERKQRLEVSPNAGSASLPPSPRTAQTHQVSETSTYSSISFPSGSRT